MCQQSIYHAHGALFDCFPRAHLIYFYFLLQEFMILPVGASSFKEAMKMGVEVYHHLKVT